MAYPITAWGAAGRRRTTTVPQPPSISTAWGARPHYTVPPGYVSTPMGSTGAAATTPPPPGGNFAGNSPAYGSVVRANPATAPQPSPGVPQAPPTAPAGPHAVPPQTDWAALIHADPRWLSAAPGFAARRGEGYASFGFHPDASGNLVPDAAGANPYSASGLLQTQFGNDSENAQNAANSRGILFSGAHVGAERAAQNQYQQNLYKALQQLQGLLSGVSTDESGLYNTIYGDLRSRLPAGGGTK